MGVGSILQHGEVTCDTTEEEIGRLFGLSVKQVNYLIAMNDGDEYEDKLDTWVDEDGFHIRTKLIRENNGIQRDFDFMGRWIEIVTALQRMA